MAEALAILLFLGSLVLCVLWELPLLLAIVFGFLCFFCYGLFRRHRPAALLAMAWRGASTVLPIILTFLTIGLLTAAWRSSGTIPYIVQAVELLPPRLLLPGAFLFCGGLAILTGTSFGTAATMGVICMLLARSMGLSEVWAAGAVLAGSYLGDHFSPMSSLNQLTARLTGTDLYANLRRMLRCNLPPLALCLGIYVLAGLLLPVGERASAALFAAHFRLHPLLLLPAAITILLAVLRVDLRLAMLASALSACILAVLVQDTGLSDLFRTLFFGFQAEDPGLARLLNGGGILSMLSSCAVVGLSSTFSGLFRGTGLLDGLTAFLRRLSARISPFGATLCTGVLTALISCNQALAIILTHQLTADCWPCRERHMEALQNSAVLLPSLVPWNIACTVPLNSIGASAACLPFALYFYLAPLWYLIRSLKHASLPPTPADEAPVPAPGHDREKT